MVLFGGHGSAHGTHGVPEKKPGSVKWEIKSTAETRRGPVTEEMWQDHLDGKLPVGIIPIREDSTCSWGSIDVDEYGDGDQDWGGSLLELVARIEKAKLPLVPCRSKSGGLHLFIFTKEPQPAGAFQAVLRDVAASLGLAGCEIFPKQSQVLTERGDVGNWMVMPYYGDTYGGKIREQVGVKRTGAEQTVEEFLKMAEGHLLTAGEFEAVGKKRTSARRGANGRAPAEPFGDGPVCLQHLAVEGVSAGGQNNTLLMMGIYYKRADPAHWKARLEEANRKFLSPPGSSDGVQAVIRSLEKKDYEYTCKVEPMCSHCDSALCRTRKHGVGGGANYPIISGLSKLTTEPPLWFVDVEDTRLSVGTVDLMNYTKFQQVCADRVHKFYGNMKQADWVRVLSTASEGLTLIEAPPELGISGRFQELLEQYLTNRSRGRVRDDLLSGRPWEDADEGRHYFQMTAFVNFLFREGLRDMSSTDANERIKRLGGGHKGMTIKGHFKNYWWVPAATIQPKPQVDVPRAAQEPI